MNALKQNVRLLVSVSLWSQIDAVYFYTHFTLCLTLSRGYHQYAQTSFQCSCDDVETFEMFVLTSIKCAEKKQQPNKQTVWPIFSGLQFKEKSSWHKWIDGDNNSNVLCALSTLFFSQFGETSSRCEARNIAEEKKCARYVQWMTVMTAAAERAFFVQKPS